MTDYTNLKARLEDRMVCSIQQNSCRNDWMCEQALAAIEELEARASRMEAFIRSCVGATVYTATDGFSKPHESEESRRARATLAEPETDNDRAK